MTEPTWTDVMQVLEANPQFLGAYGPQGQPCLTKEQKNMICGVALKKLKASLKQNGPDFFSEVWPIYRNSLATQNWFATYPKGKLIPYYILLAVIYRKASSMALKAISKKQPKPIYEVVNQVVQERFV